jgi:hypothetical protein
MCKIHRLHVGLDSSEASEICKAVGTEGGTVAGKVAGMEVGWSSVGGWLEAGIRGAGRLRASATKYPCVENICCKLRNIQEVSLLVC